MICSVPAKAIILMPSGSLHERRHVFRRNDAQHAGQGRGKAGENPAGDPAVRRHHANLPFDLEAVANDRRQVVEHFRQVAAGLTLREHRGDEEPRIENGDASREGFERVRQRHAEVLTVVHQLELRADRIRESRRQPSAARSETCDRHEGHEPSARSIPGTVLRTSRAAWSAPCGRRDTAAWQRWAPRPVRDT